MTRRLAVLVLAVAALGASAGEAAAKIVPQRSIAGVRLGMSEQQVIDRLGEPSATTRGSNDFGPYTELVYKRARLRVILQGRQSVTLVTTTSRRERTSRGVGVRSSERTVRRKVRGVRCATFAGVRSCHRGSFRPGRTVTDFLIRRGRVVRVTLAIVID